MTKKTQMKISDLFDIKLIRFIIVGVINTVVGMMIMFGLYNLAGASYWVSSFANYFLTSILSFILNKYYTFKYQGDIRGSALRFAINIAICYFLAYLVAKPLTYWLLSSYSQQIRDNVALMVGMVFFTALNYLGQRFFAFKDREDASLKNDDDPAE